MGRKRRERRAAAGKPVRGGAERKQRIKKFLKKGAIMALTGGAALPFLASKALLGKKHNKRKMKNFVANAGQEPSEDVEELATQTAMVREGQINDIVQDNENYPEIQDRETAEEEWENQQADEEEMSEFDGRESDAFTAEAIGAVLGVAKGAINKIKEKRLAKGKKFLGKNKAHWDAKAAAGGGADLNVDANGNLIASGLSNSNARDPLSNSIRDAEKGVMDVNIKKFLPIIVIAAFFLIFGKKLLK